MLCLSIWRGTPYTAKFSVKNDGVDVDLTGTTCTLKIAGKSGVQHFTEVGTTVGEIVFNLSSSQTTGLGTFDESYRVGFSDEHNARFGAYITTYEGEVMIAAGGVKVYEGV